MAIRHIPLTTYGSPVGQVNVDDEGVMTIILFPDSTTEFGVDLVTAIDNKVVTSLSLSPVSPLTTTAPNAGNAQSARFS